ncbi:RHS repeat-associated core domain-containing protein [Pseudomonas putida]
MKNSKTSLFLYQNEKLIMVKKTDGHIRTVFRTSDLSLAERSSVENGDKKLLATDESNSVLKVQGAVDEQLQAYTPYGHNPLMPSSRSLLGFNGETVDYVDLYLLGNGLRAFNTGLMRFHSPDSMSPFDQGGLNTYAYCSGDPINYQDPSGHMKKFFSRGPKTPKQSSSKTPSSSRTDQASVASSTSTMGGSGQTVEPIQSGPQPLGATNPTTSSSERTKIGFPTPQAATDATVLRRQGRRIEDKLEDVKFQIRLAQSQINRRKAINQKTTQESIKVTELKTTAREYRDQITSINAKIEKLRES